GGATRAVEARCARLHRRRADDAAVDEAGPALLDDAADFPRGGGRDSVAVDEGPGEAKSGDLLRDVEGRVRWADRQDHLAGADQRGDRADVFQPAFAGALACVRAPALARPHDARAGRAHGGAHLAAHVTWIKKPDRGHPLTLPDEPAVRGRSCGPPGAVSAARRAPPGSARAARESQRPSGHSVASIRWRAATS